LKANPVIIVFVQTDGMLSREWFKSSWGFNSQP